MKSNLIILILVLGIANVRPSDESFEPVSFHLKQTSDADGSYKYDFTSEDISKTEVRQLDGTVVGGYQYVDTNGILQRVKYTAGVEGVHMLGTNLPHDTLEVTNAKQKHYTAVQNALQLIRRAAAFEAEYKRLHPKIEKPEVVFEGFDPYYDEILRAHNLELQRRA